MSRLYLIDTLMAGLVCGFLLVINQFVKQHVWTLEEETYSLDTNETVMNSLYIRTVEINVKSTLRKDSVVCCGYSLLSKTPCSVSSWTVKGIITEPRRLPLLWNAVFWVY
jgi:hypothetical protein